MGLSATSFETDRLLIRSCQLSDAEALTALMTTDISAWVAAWPTPLTQSQTVTILKTYIDAAQKERGLGAVVIEKAQHAVIGWCALDLCGQTPSSAEMGYWIGEIFQRQGYAYELARGLIGFGFHTLGLHAMRAGAQIENTSSLTLLEKLGMTPIGVETVWAPARQRMEQCEFWEILNPEA
jgi:RimJ/RimL family protein N-acetyltransferase